MRVDVVDPSAYTPPYDHALCAALAAQGVDVRLYTSRFAYGPVATAAGYERRESFYRLAAHACRRAGSPRGQARGARAGHAALPAGRARGGRGALPVADGAAPRLALLPANRSAVGARRPLVLTAHDILPREARAGQRAAQRRLYGRFDAVVVHSEHGRARLTRELGVDAERVHVIPHGAFAHLAAAGGSVPPPFTTEKPVVLCFGLMRPYKGIDLLLEAWRGIAGAELWIVGSAAHGHLGAEGVRAGGRALRGALRRRRRAAGVLSAAPISWCCPTARSTSRGCCSRRSPFGKPLLLSDVGGFPELAARGAARTFAAGDASALHDALERAARATMRALRAWRAARASSRSATYSWEGIARRTLALYEQLLAG